MPPKRKAATKATAKTPTKSTRSKRVVKKVAEKKPAEDAASDGSDIQWEVEKVVGKRVMARKTQYQIKWKGYDAKQNTWEPASNLDCASLIAAFEAKDKAGGDEEDEKDLKVKEDMKAEKDAGDDYEEDEEESDASESKAKKAKSEVNGKKVAAKKKGKTSPRKASPKKATPKKRTAGSGTKRRRSGRK